MERAPFLQRLAQMLQHMASEQGSEAMCESMALPDHVYKVLTGEVIVQPPSKRPRSPSPVFSIPQLEVSGDFPGEFSPAESYTEEVPDVYNNSYENDSVTYAPKSPIEVVQEKVKAMYEAGTDVRMIQALFALPPVLVHSWGDFARAKHASKLVSLRDTLTERLQNGDDLRMAVKGLRMTKSHAEYLLGQCHEIEASRRFPDARRREILEEARKAPRPGNVARKYGLPKVALHRWLRGDFTHTDGESPYVQGDQWATAAQKRRCLEAFYVSRRDVEKTVLAVGFTTDAVLRVVEDFERRVMSRSAKDVSDAEDS